VQLRELIVTKRSGRKVPFDRDKLMSSVQIALRKRPVETERVERMISGIVRQLEASGENEIHSATIGQLVMEALRGLDPVAYVRFASVYRDFRDAADFASVLGEIARDAAPQLGDAGASDAGESSDVGDSSSEAAAFSRVTGFGTAGKPN
jgi:transcriptional repressor NrdR